MCVCVREKEKERKREREKERIGEEREGRAMGTIIIFSLLQKI